MREKTISVSGSSTVTDKPDQVVVKFGFESASDDQSEIVSDLSTSSERTLSALKNKHNISEDKIVSASYSVNRQKTENEGVENEYMGLHWYSVTLDDIDTVGSVIDTLLESGADNLKNIKYKLSDSTYDDLRDVAITQAVENARKEAEVAVNAEDKGIRNVHSMQVERTHRNPVKRSSGTALALMSSIDNVKTDIKNEDVSVSATVKVEYEFGYLPNN